MGFELINDNEFTDRIPQEVYEPHESLDIIVRVDIAVCVGYDPDNPPSYEDFVTGLYQNVLEKAVQGNQAIDKSDLLDWQVYGREVADD